MPLLAPFDPLNVPANHDQISSRYRDLEASPVVVFGLLLDCDDRSEIRMRNTLDYWDDLDLEPGVIEEHGDARSGKVVVWKMGDNSLEPLTKNMLSEFLNEMLKQRAIRGTILFAALQRFKANPATTLRDIEKLSNWGI